MKHIIFGTIRTVLLSAPLLAGLIARAEEPRTLTIFAAASTREVVAEATKAFQKETGIAVKLNMASSGSLARQINSGAPADVFLSASPRWSTWLNEKKDLDTGTVRELMRNRLVIIAPKGDEPTAIRFERDFPIANAFKGRLSIGDPEHVPAGRYAMGALSFYGWDKPLAKRLLPGQDVRAAMLMVELGQCDLGIVYATDATASAKVRTIATFPETSHSPIVYTISICAGTESPAGAKQLWSYLLGEETAAIMTRYGFTPAATKETE
jgi:molybdate transport system substrate-binding protein